MKLYNSIMRLFSKAEDSASSVPIRYDSEMKALSRSFDMYRGKTAFGAKSLCLPSGICAELSRLILSEFEMVSDEKTEDVSALKGLNDRLPSVVEYACATGGVILKPCYDGKKLEIQVFLPFDFIPLRVDYGKITECIFIFRSEYDGKSYIRIEEHRRTDDGYKILNRAFKGESGNEKPCALSCVPSWASICPECRISNLDTPLFSYFSMPGGNTENPLSPLGVPIFRRAEGLINEADRQFDRLIWEFEGGELAIDASEDAFRVGKDGKARLPIGKERLYRTNLLDACCSENELLKTFSPALRDTSLINGLNRILMFVEDACGISRGTFSDPSVLAKTATEVRASKQKTYATVRAIQLSLKNGFDGLLSAVKCICALYGIRHSTGSIEIKFGDGILDTETDIITVGKTRNRKEESNE